MNIGDESAAAGPDGAGAARRPGPAPSEAVHSITGAVTPHSDDLDARIRRYLISMAIRVLCVVAAIVVHARWHHWSWWIFAFGAVVLPYVAVVMANAVGRRRLSGSPLPVPPSARTMLPTRDTAADRSAGPEVVEDLDVIIHPPHRRSEAEPEGPSGSGDSRFSRPPFGYDGDDRRDAFAAESHPSSERRTSESHEWTR